MWTTEQWEPFIVILKRGFPGDFGEADELAYRLMVDDLEPADLMAALKGWTETFRPSVGDLRRVVRPFMHARLAQAELAAYEQRALDRVSHLALPAPDQKNGSPDGGIPKSTGQENG